MRKFVAGLLVAFWSVLLTSCGVNKGNDSNTTFTKGDSLTDHYLAYQDSMLEAWNIMINDDNQKIKSMHNLLHELLVTSTDEREQLMKYETQLDQLLRLRYTQNSMGNADVIEEYDFASTTLVRELISLAESETQFVYNSTLQKLVEDIRLADERVNNYREEYDMVVGRYNLFIDKNKHDLLELNHTDSLHKKHLFQVVSMD